MAGDINMKHQLAFYITHARVLIEWLELATEDKEGPHQTNCPNNASISELHLKAFGKEVGLKDVYKSHLESGPTNDRGASIDSARANLADTFVSTFVNAHYGNDEFVKAEEGNSWIYNKQRLRYVPFI